MSEVTLQGENPSPKQWTAPNGVGQQKAIPFWVVVPTLNPGLKAWTDWIAALKAQDSQPQKVIIVDSGSDDGSLALTQSEGFSLFHVKALNFDHGGTRQWALAQALQAAQNEGISPPEVVVFITQDALLAPPVPCKTWCRPLPIRKLVPLTGGSWPSRMRLGWSATRELLTILS